MSFGETKVYFDGSHYIAIPHTEKPYRKRRKFIEEEITVIIGIKTSITIKIVFII